MNRKFIQRTLLATVVALAPALMTSTSFAMGSRSNTVKDQNSGSNSDNGSTSSDTSSASGGSTSTGTGTDTTSSGTTAATQVSEPARKRILKPVVPRRWKTRIRVRRRAKPLRTSTAATRAPVPNPTAAANKLFKDQTRTPIRGLSGRKGPLKAKGFVSVA